MTLTLAMTACGPVADDLDSERPTDRFFEFALLGDNPYTQANVGRFETLIADVNARPDVQWVIHLGDTKGGAAPCTDEMMVSRFELYRGFSAPFVITPGDNDWYDCSQTGSDEYERLEFFRELYYPRPRATAIGAPPLELAVQSDAAQFEEFVENVRWVRDGVVFATIHLVVLTRPSDDPSLDQRRLAAALAWIDETFRVALEKGADAVFLATQADPWPVSGLPLLVGALCERCLEPRPGLEELYPALVRHARAFPGPVVLAVGDTHVFRVDKPLYDDEGQLVENFTRAEAFGHPDVYWVRVRVDPGEAEAFTFHREILAAGERSQPGSPSSETR